MFKEEADVVVGMFHARWIGIGQCQAPTGQIFIAAQNNHLNHLIPDFVAFTRMSSIIWVPTSLTVIWRCFGCKIWSPPPDPPISQRVPDRLGQLLLTSKQWTSSCPSLSAGSTALSTEPLNQFSFSTCCKSIFRTVSDTSESPPLFRSHCHSTRQSFGLSYQCCLIMAFHCFQTTSKFPRGSIAPAGFV